MIGSSGVVAGGLGREGADEQRPRRDTTPSERFSFEHQVLGCNPIGERHGFVGGSREDDAAMNGEGAADRLVAFRKTSRFACDPVRQARAPRDEH